MLLLVAEPHHPLDVRAVVPAAIEEHDLAARGQQRHVPLEVPLGLLAFGRLRERFGAHDARARSFADPFDHATLAGRSSAFEDDQDTESLALDPVLELDQLLLHLAESRLVELLPQASIVVVVLVAGRS